ncbi:MAG: nucleotidyltransferase family protein [Nanoarchaeota archaeon]
MKAVILAGGKGTRLRPLTLHTPKALVDIQGKTMTEHLFDLFKRHGIIEVIMTVGYLKDKIKSYYGDGSKFGMKISYIDEDEPLGTAGALKQVKNILNESFIVTNGDELKDIDIDKMLEVHKKNNSYGTIALTKVEDPSRYGVARLKENKILEFVEKPKKEEAPSNLINSGFYILEPEVIDRIPEGFAMFEKDIFPFLAKEGKLHGFPFDEQWFDTGNMERLEKARNEWKGLSKKDF